MKIQYTILLFAVFLMTMILSCQSRVISDVSIDKLKYEKSCMFSVAYPENTEECDCRSLRDNTMSYSISGNEATIFVDGNEFQTYQVKQWIIEAENGEEVLHGHIIWNTGFDRETDGDFFINPDQKWVIVRDGNLMTFSHKSKTPLYNSILDITQNKCRVNL